MREILFRGKCSDGVWCFGFYLKAMYHWTKYGIHEDWIVENASQNGGYLNTVCRHAVITETIGQFTGLTDKNGKKIFEGDIVHCISIWDEANLVVIFEDGEFRMVLSEQYKEYKPGCGFYAVRNFVKEVIGNIHDNPELLEGGAS